MSVDHHGLHQVLWMDAHPVRHTLRINHAQLAVQWHRSRGAMGRVLAKLEEAGRITRLGAESKEAVYRIADPADFEASE